MPAPDTVGADGVDWPLQTFIDSYGMIVTEGARPAFCDPDPIVDVLMDNGSYVTRQPASLVEWSHVHAFVSSLRRFGENCTQCGDDTLLADLVPSQLAGVDCGLPKMADFEE